MELVARLIFIVVLLILVQELFRRAGKWAAWGVFLVLPLALAPYWVWNGWAGAYTGVGIFPWIKLISLQVAAGWLTALRFTSLGRSRWALGLMFLMLPLNMLEAINQDAFGGHLAHYLLGLTGPRPEVGRVPRRKRLHAWWRPRSSKPKRVLLKVLETLVFVGFHQMQGVF